MTLNQTWRAMATLLTAFSTSLLLAAGPNDTTEWAQAVNLGSPVNSIYSDVTAALSKDGNSLYFASTRPCGPNDTILDLNLWVAHWSSADNGWSAPECLSINNPSAVDNAPALSRDGHWLFFISDRPGSNGTPGTLGGRDIWVSWREHVHDDEAWSTPVNARAINSSTTDAGTAYLEDGDSGWPQLFFASDRDGTAGIWVVDLLGEMSFGTPRRIGDGTNQIFGGRPSVSHSGLELFFDRGGEIYLSTRPDLSSPWNAATALGPAVNGPFSELQASLSGDGALLFFTSTRPGGLGGLDIWVSTRTNHFGQAK